MRFFLACGEYISRYNKVNYIITPLNQALRPVCNLAVRAAGVPIPRTPSFDLNTEMPQKVVGSPSCTAANFVDDGHDVGPEHRTYQEHQHEQYPCFNESDETKPPAFFGVDAPVGSLSHFHPMFALSH
jgi:hypothetical protein